MSVPKNRKWFAVAAILALLAVQIIVAFVSAKLADRFNYRDMESYAVFTWKSVRHVMQLIISAALVLLLKFLLRLDFGFKIGDYKTGLRYVMIYSLTILVYAPLSFIVGYFFNIVQPYPYPLILKNILGTLGFQLFLTGTSEEILFRALPITVLIFAYGKSIEIRIGKFRMTAETLICAILFSLAHISWSVNPLSLSADYVQLVFAFAVAIFQGKAYQESGSVFYPMMMHSIGNVIAVGTGYLFTAFYPWK